MYNGVFISVISRKGEDKIERFQTLKGKAMFQGKGIGRVRK